MKRAALAVFALSVALVLGASPAHADTAQPEVAPEIASALERVPGGVVIDYWTAEWPAQEMRLEVPNMSNARSSAAARAVGTCATGRICAFGGYATAGAKLSWTGCGPYSTSAIGTVRSIANARSSGTMYARNGAAVTAYTGAGTWTNVFRPVSTVKC